MSNASGLRVAFNKYECYGGGDGPYEVELELGNLVSGEATKLRAVIDTGFDGNVMVDSKTYVLLKLRLSEKPESQFPAYRTFSGTVLFRSSLARISLVGRNVVGDIVTPVNGMGKVLLGRRALKEFTTLLHRDERHCIGEARLVEQR